ncbi:MAG: TIGR03915 family putative DNA repair protein [Oscillospiraceae bacterium]|nr:TIGR03915 family putative DNA repair protein [Oscillospiraceae bacterium]
MHYGTDLAATEIIDYPAAPEQVRQQFSSNIAYVYDGSFEGLLCCVYESYYQKELPSAIFSYDQAQETLFPAKEIATNRTSAQKVLESIGRKISREALKLVRACYFSEKKDREIMILEFLRLGYKIGSAVTNMLSHDTVRAVTKTALTVQRESHYHVEFLRFSEYDGVMVAIIEPKNFVLPMMYAHFCDRFPSEQFLIYDKSHKHAFIYQNGEKSLIPLEHLELPKLSAKEEKYHELWKRFYDTIAIEGRINHKLRMNNMPKRYWTHMTEFQ